MIEKILANPILIILGISIAVFLAIILLRIIFTIILTNIIKKYSSLLKKTLDSFKPTESSGVKTEDERFRDKEKERKKKMELLARLPGALDLAASEEVKEGILQRLDNNLDLENEEALLNKREIVGIVKPIGRWTSLILGQKVTYLMQHANLLKEQNDLGYWVNMINAKDRMRGKSQARGRG